MKVLNRFKCLDTDLKLCELSRDDTKNLNTKYNYVILKNNEIISESDSIKSLIIEFNKFKR